VRAQVGGEAVLQGEQHVVQHEVRRLPAEARLVAHPRLDDAAKQRKVVLAQQPLQPILHCGPLRMCTCMRQGVKSGRQAGRQAGRA
jgi:hypothetical protein